MKKIVSLILALAMIFALGITAFAADNAPTTEQIPIKLKPVVGRTYNFYRVLDAKIVNAEKARVQYHITDNFRDFFLGDTAPGKVKGFVTTKETEANEDAVAAFWTNKGDGKQSVYYLNVNDSNVDDFVKALEAFIKERGITPEETIANAQSSDVVTKTVTSGYYVITSDGGSRVMSTTNYIDGRYEGEYVIVDKNAPPEVDKKVAILDSNNEPVDEYADYVYVECGETVRFRIEVPVGAGAENYVICDDYDVLEFNVIPSSVEVYYIATGDDTKTEVALAGGQYNATGIDGGDMKVAINDATFDYEGKAAIVLYFDAEPNGVVPPEGYQNKVKVTYGDNQETNTDDAWVYGAGIEIWKIANSNYDIKLGGAKFKVYKMVDGAKMYLKEIKDDNGDLIDIEWIAAENVAEATEYETYTSTEDDPQSDPRHGKVLIRGLRYLETYYLEETKAPKGFNKTEKDTVVELKVENLNDNNAVKISYFKNNKAPEGVNYPQGVDNKSGTILPETGGMGTTLFYILGSLMAVGALVVLVTNKRVRV